MFFNSYEYLLFLPIVVAVYFSLASRFRSVWLLLASYFFYMSWEPLYALLLVASTVVDYGVGLGMQRWPRRKGPLLALSLLVNLGLLFAFKYYGFLARSVAILGSLSGHNLALPMLDVLLPVGISFYTFQTLSYTIEIYRGKMEPERSFVQFALYVSFFAQLVAGPIERAQHLLPQFTKHHVIEIQRLLGGGKLIAWGLFKKIVIADRIGMLVDPVYTNPSAFEGPACVLATFLFGYQIYCDFSGYTDVAIGSARILGIDLRKNFDRPYAARSLTEFWQRWHISLSSWFRDYVYIPLGGNQKGFRRLLFNIGVVFILSGLWHGANFTFLAWGILHGALLMVEQCISWGARKTTGAHTGHKWSKVASLFRWFVVYSCVNLAWLFFRSDSITDAWMMIKRLPLGWCAALHAPSYVFSGIQKAATANSSEFFLLAVLILFAEIVAFTEQDVRMLDLMAGRSPCVRWMFYLMVCIGILNLGVSKAVPFIYFQF